MFLKCFHQAKTLAVSNTDSTTDVIRMALLQFGISVSTQDNRLYIHWLYFEVVLKRISIDTSVILYLGRLKKWHFSLKCKINLVNLSFFPLQGCVKDHRLWVSSSKDDPPYPLIGEPTFQRHHVKPFWTLWGPINGRINVIMGNCSDPKSLKEHENKLLFSLKTLPF